MNRLVYVILSCEANVLVLLSSLNEAKSVKCSGYFGGTTKENWKLRLTLALREVFSSEMGEAEAPHSRDPRRKNLDGRI